MTAAGAVADPTGSVITAVTPAHGAGAVSVIVATAGGTSGAVTYTYVTTAPTPTTLAAIIPASGTTAGGTTITLTGANLTGASATFGGIAAVSTVVDPTGTMITAVTPPHAAGAVSVTANTPGGISGAVTYTYTAPASSVPTLTAINPASGTTDGGTLVTLIGANLTGASVYFGGTPAAGAIVDATGTVITAVTPIHAAGGVSVTVSTAGGISGAVTYAYTAPATTVPSLATISPATGGAAGGTSVTLNGVNLTGASVSFGGTPATSAVADATGTMITAVTPAHAAGAVGVTVTTAGGTSGAATYTYTAANASGPTLTAVSPASGGTAGGTSVTLTGTNLTGASVSFGGTSASVAGSSGGGDDDEDAGGASPGSSTSITVQTPAHASGTVTVTVQTASGTSNGLSYTYGSSSSEEKSLSAPMFETVLPVPIADAPDATIPSNSVLSVRVTNATPIDPTSVSALLTSTEGSAQGGVWRPTTPGDDTDGWVMFTPEQPLPEGGTVTLTVNAQAVDGNPIEPISAQFFVAGPGQTEQAADAPVLSESAGVEPLPDTAIIPNAVSYQLNPAEVFIAPVTVQIPVPEGSDPATLDVYYHSLSPTHQGWFPGQDIMGWMVPNSQHVVKDGAETFIEIQVNHAGMVELGQAGNK